MHEKIQQAISEALPGAAVEVYLDGNRALITVVSQAFEGMSRVKKQQSIYACIEEFISDGSLHAVTIRAQTPDEVS